MKYIEEVEKSHKQLLDDLTKLITYKKSLSSDKPMRSDEAIELDNLVSKCSKCHQKLLDSIVYDGPYERKVKSDRAKIHFKKYPDMSLVDIQESLPDDTVKLINEKGGAVEL